MVWRVLLVWVFCASGAAWAIEADSLNAEDSARYRALLAQLRCLVCQNQSLADSPASFAQDMRAALKQKIRAGDSDETIYAFMTQRYGDFILYQPPLNATTILLWATPFLVLLLGVAVVLRLLRRAPDEADEADGADEAYVTGGAGDR